MKRRIKRLTAICLSLTMSGGIFVGMGDKIAYGQELNSVQEDSVQEEINLSGSTPYEALKQDAIENLEKLVRKAKWWQAQIPGLERDLNALPPTTLQDSNAAFRSNLVALYGFLDKQEDGKAYFDNMRELSVEVDSSIQDKNLGEIYREIDRVQEIVYDIQDAVSYIKIGIMYRKLDVVLRESSESSTFLKEVQLRQEIIDFMTQKDERYRWGGGMGEDLVGTVEAMQTKVDFLEEIGMIVSERRSLEKLYNEEKGFFDTNKEKYTEETAKIFSDTLDQAKVELDKENPEREKINKLLLDIPGAKAQLREKSPETPVPPTTEQGGNTPKRDVPPITEQGGNTPKKDVPPTTEQGGNTPKKDVPPTTERGGNTPKKDVPPTTERGGNTPKVTPPAKEDNGGSSDSGGSGYSGGGSGRSITKRRALNSGAERTKTLEGYWKQNGDDWQFILKNGEAIKSEWAYLSYNNNDDWYYFSQDGNMFTGWLKNDAGNWYFLNDKTDGRKGAMLTGWQWIMSKDGKYRCYYFNDELNGKRGSMENSKLIDGKYTVNTNGEWVVDSVVQVK